LSLGSFDTEYSDYTKVSLLVTASLKESLFRDSIGLEIFLNFDYCYFERLLKVYSCHLFLYPDWFKNNRPTEALPQFVISIFFHVKPR